MVKAAIVEDETSCAEELSSFFKRYMLENNFSFQTTIFTTADQFLAHYKVGEFDIIFMDIEMPGTNGMEAAKILRKKDSEVILFFVTNLSQYALESYEVQAFNFMVKPIKYGDFSMKMGRAIRRVVSDKDNKLLLTYKNDDRVMEKIVPISSIRYVEVCDHNIIWHMVDENINGVRGETMKTIQARLSGYGFAMCDQSFLVNIKYITSVDKEEVHIGNDVIKISRRRRQEFLAVVARHLSFADYK